jgi:hypothetical protein
VLGEILSNKAASFLVPATEQAQDLHFAIAQSGRPAGGAVWLMSGRRQHALEGFSVQPTRARLRLELFGRAQRRKRVSI